MTMLSILARGSLFLDDGFRDDNIASKAASFGFVKTASEGYKSATIGLPATLADIANWQNGLGRHIEFWGSGILWEGFVNQIDIVAGGLTLTIGELLNIANKVTVQYQTITYNTNPPVGGESATTAAASDTDSQTRYGILETILSGGQGTQTEMEQLRDTYLASYKDPQPSQQLSLGGGRAEIRLSCEGYGRYLDRFTYTQTATSGTQNASAKIAAVIAADPNSLILDRGFITTNTLAVPQYENDGRTGLEAINDVTARGDSADDRWLFNVKARRIAYYNQVPDKQFPLYTWYLGSNRIETAGTLLQPWEIEAGEWILVPDAPGGQQYVFAENVQYSSAYGLSVDGGRTDTLYQTLAKLGLGSSA